MKIVKVLLIVLAFVLVASILDFVLLKQTSFLWYVLINCWEGGIFLVGIIIGYFLKGKETIAENHKGENK